MNLVEALNSRGAALMDFAVPWLAQTTVVMIVVFAIDLVLRKRLRAAVRYALWLLVLVKLVLPPSLSSPTALGYWLQPKRIANAPLLQNEAPTVTVIVSDASTAPRPLLVESPAQRSLTRDAWLMLGWFSGLTVLLGVLMYRSRRMLALAREAEEPEEMVSNLLGEVAAHFHLRHTPRLKLTYAAASPGVCGIFRPLILLPKSLADHLSRPQLRAVLMHEVSHIIRGDLWLNNAQALLQVVFWWHPLLWFVNARIRRVREEATDDAVMVALDGDADIYPATLIEVARHLLTRPLVTLGLLGIIESRNALKHRIQRLLDGQVPKSANLTLYSVAGCLLFGSILLPMAQGQRSANSALSPTPRFTKADQQQFVTDTLPDPALPGSSNTEPLSIQKTSSGSALDVLQPGEKPNTSLPRTPRQAIVLKLANTVWPETKLREMTLSNLVTILADETRKQNPERKGINFIVNSHIDLPQVAIDPATRTQVTIWEPSDLNTNLITLDHAIKGAHIIDLLDSIVKGSTLPLEYSVTDYAVVFSQRRKGPELVTRVLKVDPVVFVEGLKRAWRQIQPPSTLSQHDPEQPENLPALLKQFFAQAGINFDPALSRNVLYFIERRGTLFVRASVRDFEVIEAALLKLNASRPMSAPDRTGQTERFRPDSVSTAFVGLKTNEVRPPAVQVPPVGAGAEPVPVVTKQSPIDSSRKREQIEVEVRLSEDNGRGNFKDIPLGLPAEQFTNSGLLIFEAERPMTNASVTLNLWRLDADHMRAVTNWLMRPGVDLLNAPKTVLQEGRENQIAIVDTKSVIIAKDATTGGFRSRPEAFGVFIDITPELENDGKTIGMTIVATTRQFTGYGKSRTPRPTRMTREYKVRAVVSAGETLAFMAPSWGNAKNLSVRKEELRTLLVLVTPKLSLPRGIER